MTYRWVPSGCSPDYMQEVLWVRNRTNSGNRISHSINGVSPVLHLPDSEIIFDHGRTIFDEHITKNRIIAGFIPMRVGPFHHPENVLKKYGPYFMTSAHSLSPGAWPGFAKKGGALTFLDSGGAQLKFGVTSYVDPKEVIQIYNECGDVGMALDLPPRTRLEPRRDIDSFPMALRELALVQRRNNNYFATHKRDDLRLLNVAHGLSGDDFRRWIEAVKNSKFEGWAISYDSDLDPYCIWRGAAVLYREFGGAENWMHLFGVSGLTKTPLMAWLGKRIPNLTSDSSSWIKNATGYNYLHNRDGRMQSIAIGDGFARMREMEEDSLEPYCRCEFCQLLRTFGAYRETFRSEKSRAKGSGGSLVTKYVLAAHNLIAIKEGMESWNDRATRMGMDEFQDEIRDCFPRARGGTDYGSTILHMLDYLECALVNGPEYADVHVARDLSAMGFLNLAS